MNNVRVEFEVLPERQNPPVGWSKVTGHLIWDVKMDLTLKERWVLDEHKNPGPIGSTCSGVVSREIVRITFVCAALNGIELSAADIRNAYLQSPLSKNTIFYGP